MESKWRYAYRLRKTEFDGLMARIRGEQPDHKVAELFDLTAAQWSLIRNGKRPMNGHVIGVCDDLLPGIPLLTYAEKIKVEARAAS